MIFWEKQGLVYLFSKIETLKIGKFYIFSEINWKVKYNCVNYSTKIIISVKFSHFIVI